MRNLDQLDLDILAHLFRDAGMTNKDLAALVGVAPSTCLERVRKLQQDGVLKGAHCEVDYQALGGHIQAMVSLAAGPSQPPDHRCFPRCHSGAARSDQPVPHGGQG